MSTSSLTVKQAAAGLGVSPKTIRRRIAEGALSASKEFRGKQEVVLIEGSELARYAEGANLRLDPSKLGQAGTGDAATIGPRGPQADGEGAQDPDGPQVDQGQGEGCLLYTSPSPRD